MQPPSNNDPPSSELPTPSGLPPPIIVNPLPEEKTKWYTKNWLKLAVVSLIFITAVGGLIYFFLILKSSSQNVKLVEVNPNRSSQNSIPKGSTEEYNPEVTHSIPSFIPDFTPSKHVYVLEDPGNIDTKENFNINELTKLFYSKYPDKYDFISIFPAFSLKTETTTFARAQGLHYTVQSKVKGICYPLVDPNPSHWGSSKLQGVHVYSYTSNDYGEWLENFPKKMRLLLEETSHQWLVYLGQAYYGTNESCKDTTLPLLGVGSHWSRGLQTPPGFLGAMKEAGPWIDNGNGTYTAEWGSLVDKPSKFHPFDLYLMGLADKSEIEDEFLLLSDIQDFDFKNNLYKAKAQKVTINDIIKIAGDERSPNYRESQKDFNLAFVILTRPKEEVPESLSKTVTAAANTFPSAWAFATDYQSNINNKE